IEVVHPSAFIIHPCRSKPVAHAQGSQSHLLGVRLAQGRDAMKKPSENFKVVITDVTTEVGPELEVLSQANCELVVAQCKSEDDVIAVGKDADALLVGDAPVSAKVMAALGKCKIIV